MEIANLMEESFKEHPHTDCLLFIYCTIDKIMN